MLGQVFEVSPLEDALGLAVIISLAIFIVWRGFRIWNDVDEDEWWLKS